MRKPESVGTGKCENRKPEKPENGKARYQIHHGTGVAVWMSAGLIPCLGRTKMTRVMELEGQKAGRRNAPERDRGMDYNRRESEATSINPLKYKAYL